MTIGGLLDPLLAITYSSPVTSNGADLGEILDESGLLPLLIPSLSSARSPSLLLPNELLGDLTGADKGGESRNDGNGNLAILGSEAAGARLVLLPIDELDSLGSVNDSLAPVTGAAFRGEGASLVGRTKNRAASPIWCSAKFQH